MKLITFSLWGNDPKYDLGAIENAKLAKEIYPGWKCRFYLGNTVGDDISIKLRELGAEVLIHRTPGDWRSMFWRFEPAGEDDVEVMISRDCDSRLSQREAQAVEDWLCGPKLIHSMGDHLYHYNPSQALMGGLWGAKQGAIPNMTELLEQFTSQYPNAWQCDQSFLRDVVWPQIQYKVLAHSDLHPGCEPFPTKRDGNNFVGAIMTANGERAHPEHHALINSGHTRKYGSEG